MGEGWWRGPMSPRGGHVTHAARSPSQQPHSMHEGTEAQGSG